MNWRAPHPLRTGDDKTSTHATCTFLYKTFLTSHIASLRTDISKSVPLTRASIYYLYMGTIPIICQKYGSRVVFIHTHTLMRPDVRRKTMKMVNVGGHRIDLEQICVFPFIFRIFWHSKCNEMKTTSSLKLCRCSQIEWFRFTTNFKFVIKCYYLYTYFTGQLDRTNGWLNECMWF